MKHIYAAQKPRENPNVRTRSAEASNMKNKNPQGSADAPSTAGVQGERGGGGSLREKQR